MRTNRKQPGGRRGSVLLMTLVYVLLFGALASAMVAFSQGNMKLGMAETQANRALSAAESGMSYLLLQLRITSMPTIKEGSIANMSGSYPVTSLWAGSNIEGLNGNSGIAPQLAASLQQCGAFAVSGSTVASPSGTSPLLCPAIVVDPTVDNSSFTLAVSWDANNPYLVHDANGNVTTSYVLLHLKSMGVSGTTSKTVKMDIRLQKTLKYAVFSNVAIQLGKNVRVQGDVYSAFTGTTKGPPVQMFSDFHYLSDMSALDTDLGNLRNWINTWLPNNLDNHINLNSLDPNTADAAKADAFSKGLLTRTPTFVDSNGVQHYQYSDFTGSGYLDEYGLFQHRLDANKNQIVSSGEFIDAVTGKAYDSDLWNLIDSPMGPVDPVTGLVAGQTKPWAGYGDSQLVSNPKYAATDSYAKVNGTVKMAITLPQWQAAASGWSQWGDGGGTRFQDLFEGPVISPDPTVPAVQFSANVGNELTMTPQNFDTSGFDSQISNTTAAVVKSGGVTSAIHDGTLTAAMANGGSVTEHSPSDVSSGWQATYSRPVFQNVNFTNVRIPQGLNAKFINCTFNGYTMVKLNTNITKAGTSTTTYDPSLGMGWAQQMTKGSFTANTTLTASNSVAFTNGNNLHFSSCTFNGVVTADVPTAYTHFADSWEFDGITAFNNGVDQSVTIMAPNTNIEVGGYTNPGGNPSTLTGVVVAGNIDVRGTANIDGSLLIVGNGATNTTLGYFGSTDQGQGVPPPAQLPAQANGGFGHLFFRYNPDRGMPNGITIPLTVYPQFNTYQIQ